MNVKKGVFACNTSTGNQSVTGVGFQPKAVILWGVKLASNNTFTSGDNAFWFGAATSATNRWCMAGAEDDAVTTSNTGRRLSTDRVIHILASGTPTTEAVANLVSFDTDGFTINWSSAPTSAWQCHYMALGGSTITNARAGATSTTPDSSTAITGVGFKPDLLMMVGINTGNDTSASNKTVMVGLASGSGSSSQAVVASRYRDAMTTTDNISYQDTGYSFALLSGVSSSFSWRGSLASFDTDGFTISWTNTLGFNQNFCYLALKGGAYRVITDTQRTATTGTRSTTGVGFQPVGALFASWGSTASGGSIDTSQARLTISASDGTNEGGFWWQSADNVTTTDLDQKSFTDKALLLATQPSTTDAEADLASFDTDGFTLDWTTVADSTERRFITVLFGDHRITPATQEDDAAVAAGRLKMRAVSSVTDAQTTLTVGRIHQRSVTTMTQDDAAVAAGRIHQRSVTTMTQDDAAVAAGRIHQRSASSVTDAQTTLTVGRIHQRSVTTTTGTDTARIINIEANIVTRAFDHPAPVISAFDAPTRD
jgi:hypothetical protein